MELLQNLWNVLSTEDENLTRYISLSLTFIEIYVSMKLFTTILNINYTPKQRNIFIVLMSSLIIIANLLFPSTINIFLGLIFIPIIIKTTFKTSVTKSFLALIIPMLISLIIESLYSQICLKLFNLTTVESKNILIYRIPIMLFIYLSMFIISAIIKTFKNNKSVLDCLDSYRKKLFIINLFLIIVLIGVQFYIFIFYNKVLPFYITVISLVFLIIYAIVSIYSIIKSINLDIIKQNLEQSELHNKSLELLYNNVSAFRHDISNIITAFGGFIYSKNMDGLEKYYNKILDELNINNNLSTLNPKVINNPAIYNILATKYYKADELNIDINLQVFINLNKLKMDIYDFCRILGILLDNAIEASSECENKLINIDFRDIKINKCQSITIENTYLDKNIDISKLAEKGYTSKKEDKKSHGIGLWQVAKILKKHDNVILDTSKDDSFFKQELVIYY